MCLSRNKSGNFFFRSLHLTDPHLSQSDTMTQVKRYTERVANPLSDSERVVVDFENCVIRNVLLCGYTSQNKRDYPWDKLRDWEKKYEGRPVNCNHGVEAVERQCGWLENIRPDRLHRPRGDIYLFKQHKDTPLLLERAKRKPQLFGMSHVADCKSRYESKSGREVIEDIIEVVSVDIVTNPATTKTLEESKQRNAMTIRQFLESIAGKAPINQVLKLRRLSEMDGMGDLPMGDPAEDADPADGITEAFKNAIMSVVEKALSGDEDPKIALGKIKKLLNSHGDVNGDGKVDDADVDAADKRETDTKESRGEAVLASMKIFESLNCPVTATDLDLVASVSADKRESLVKRLAAKPDTATTPTGPRSTPRYTESKNTTTAKKRSDNPMEWLD